MIIDHHNEPFSSCEMSSNLLFSLPLVLLDQGLFYGGHVVLLAVDFFSEKTYFIYVFLLYYCFLERNIMNSNIVVRKATLDDIDGIDSSIDTIDDDFGDQ